MCARSNTCKGTKELYKTIQEQNAKISQLEDEMQKCLNPTQTNSYSQAVRSGPHEPHSEDLSQRIQSQMEQISVTLNDHQKLLETKTHINHDLTRKLQKELRETKKQLHQLPQYSSKKIHTYQGKLYVEHKPVPEAELITLNTSE